MKQEIIRTVQRGWVLVDGAYYYNRVLEHFDGQEIHLLLSANGASGRAMRADGTFICRIWRAGCAPARDDRSTPAQSDASFRKTRVGRRPPLAPRGKGLRVLSPSAGRAEGENPSGDADTAPECRREDAVV